MIWLFICDSLISVHDWFRNLFIYAHIKYLQFCRPQNRIIYASAQIESSSIEIDVFALVICFYIYNKVYSPFKMQRWIKYWYGVSTTKVKLLYHFNNNNNNNGDNNDNNIIYRKIDLVLDKEQVQIVGKLLPNNDVIDNDISLDAIQIDKK